MFRPAIVLPLAAALMAAVIAAAIGADCARIARQLQARVALADEPLLKSEGRVVELLRGQSALPLELETALQRYDPAALAADRHATFEQLAGRLPLLYSRLKGDEGQRLRDEIDGALNRRNIALQAYREQLAAWTAFRDSWRGRVAARLGAGA